VVWRAAWRVPYARGATTTRDDGTTATQCIVLPPERAHECDGYLASWRGGSQGCGGATLLCVGAYHETLCEIQRDHQHVNITCTADDTYLNGECESLGAVFACFDDKRRRTAHDCLLRSKLPKVNVYSPQGDLTLAPPDLPGSPSYPGDKTRAAGERCLFLKVAGNLIGEPAACSDGLCRIVQRRLAPLSDIMLLEDDDVVANVTQLQTNLLRLNASAIPSYWTQNMPPSVVARAAAFADHTVAAAFAQLFTRDSPPDRAALALRLARLPLRIGGLGLARHSDACHSAYAAAFIAAWPTCLRVFPSLSAVSIATPTAHQIAASAFPAAYSHILTTTAGSAL
jgi:hypothetical protein